MINVGDILVSSFGYNCTLIAFYKVISKSESGKTVKLVRLQNQIVEDDGYGQIGRVIPSEIIYDKKILTRRIISDTVKIESCEIAFPWNGKPVYFNSCD